MDSEFETDPVEQRKVSVHQIDEFLRSLDAFLSCDDRPGQQEGQVESSRTWLERLSAVVGYLPLLHRQFTRMFIVLVKAR
jgi:hypothetical protein